MRSCPHSQGRSRPTLATMALYLVLAHLAAPGLCRPDEAKITEVRAPQPPPAEYRAKWAIIIGVNDYRQDSGLAQLKYAANDAREFRRLLVEEFGYDNEHVFYLTDSQGEPAEIVNGRPTRAAILDAFEKWLPSRGLTPEDSVMFFFAGHGVHDRGSGETYIAASDSKAQDSKGSCIRVGWVRSRLGDKQVVKCRHRLILLDCCFSGGLFMFDQPLAARPVPKAPEGPGKPASVGANPPPAMRGNGSRLGRGGDDVS